ncbi:F-box only protein 28 [Procambarus clarkii]|uniref:F-box only protein 28 n=1 Tax=Procambarus clarkii TaxID=6728 RepID=UPI003744A5F6
MEGKGNRQNFLDLPEIVVEKILGYISYEELSHLRIVCRRFNQLNQLLLNKGFRRVERYQAKCLKEVKSQLPRRESERRNHPLFRHCDILTAIETRLSLLNMTFIKYVDCHMCCFIPGKVIDEIYRVLRFVQSNKTLPRAHEILTELRDISSMAMEHFEEKIIRTLKPTSLTPSSPRFSLSTTYSTLSPLTSPSTASTAGSSLNRSLSSSSSSSSSVSSSDDLPHLIASNKYYRNCVNILKKEVSDQKSKLNELRRKVSEQERVALEQNRILSEQTVKFTSQEGKLNEVNRKLLEYDQRFSELVAEMARMREGCIGDPNSSSVTGASWGREGKNHQFYGSHNLPSPAIGSTVFVAANMVRPNLVPVNLASAQLSSPAYVTSPTLSGFATGGISLGESPAPEASPTSPVHSPNIVSSSNTLETSQCMQGTVSQSSTSLQNPTQEDTQTVGSSASSSQTICEAAASGGKSHGKKYRKRKLSGGKGTEDAPQLKWKKI